MAFSDKTWKAPTVTLTSIMTTGLNSLANDAIELETTVINNETNLVQFMDVSLDLASVDLSAQTNPAAHLYLIPSIDGGTTFADGSDAVTADASMPAVKHIRAILAFRVHTGAETKYDVSYMIPIPPGQWNFGLRNKLGVAFPATGNILKYRTYAEKIGIP